MKLIAVVVIQCCESFCFRPRGVIRSVLVVPAFFIFREGVFLDDVFKDAITDLIYGVIFTEAIESPEAIRAFKSK